MIPTLIPVSLDNCWMLECTVFLTPCALISFYNVFNKIAYILSYQRKIFSLAKQKETKQLIQLKQI